MNEIGELDGKPLTLDMLTSDTWDEFEKKLIRTKWKKLCAVHAIRRNGKIVALELIPIEIRIEIKNEG